MIATPAFYSRVPIEHGKKVMVKNEDKVASSIYHRRNCSMGGILGLCSGHLLLNMVSGSLACQD